MGFGHVRTSEVWAKPIPQLVVPDRGIKVARALNAIRGRGAFASSTSCDLGIKGLYNSVGEVAIVASMKTNATQSLANTMVALMPPDDPASTMVTICDHEFVRNIFN
jgi:hypothetical protein